MSQQWEEATRQLAVNLIEGLQTFLINTESIPEPIPEPEPEPLPEVVGALLADPLYIDGAYTISWTQPSNQKPKNYDIIIDGTDTNETNRTDDTAITLTGLDPKKAHTFQVEARFVEREGVADEWIRSNEVSISPQQ